MRERYTVLAIVSTVISIALLAEPSMAHVGSLGGTVQSGGVPVWLTIATGGVIVGASFLFTSLLTDHAAIRAINSWYVMLSTPEAVRTATMWSLRLFSVSVLGLIVVTGLFGPQVPTANFAILVVWAGWWAGYTMSIYLVGNTWMVLNPWRALATVLPRLGDRAFPERLGAWPSVIGLLGLVWIEVVSPVAAQPQLLVSLILAYSVVTLLGASLYGVDTWFRIVDPIARVFRCYGRMAPIQRTNNGIEFKLPTAVLAEGKLSEETGATAFIVALLWVTTYDGLVSTPTWATFARAVVSAGVPPLVVYSVTIVLGFGLFLLIFRLASRKARETASTYVTASFIRRWFAPSLLPIAAGYHFAHFLGYFLTLMPALATIVTQPFSPPTNVLVLVLPPWFGIVQLLIVLVGHFFAVWIAHALSFELFPGTLKPIRSQYPFIVVMIFYTMTSMWVITQPFTAPPYV